MKVTNLEMIFKNDIHSAISDLKEAPKKDFKGELASLRHELNRKPTEVGTRLQGHDQVIAEEQEGPQQKRLC